MTTIGTVTRRSLLIGSAAVLGGVVIGYLQHRRPHGNPLTAQLSYGEYALTPYVRIDQDGVTIIAPRAEMGQGVHTSLAALVAEEMDLDWRSLRVEHGPASAAYYNAVVLEEGLPFATTDDGVLAQGARDFTDVPAKLLGMQVTGASSSLADAFDKMRNAGATARNLLLLAAAEQSGIALTELATDAGAVVTARGQRFDYTSLAPTAATIASTLEPAQSPALTHRANWKLIGQSLPRVDMHAKCTGTAQFSIDVAPDDLLYATVKMNPHLGGSVIAFDASAAQPMPGVRFVIKLDGAVAVIATNTWYALQAAKAIDVQWGPAPYLASTQDMFDAATKSFGDDHLDSQLRDDGDVDAALADATSITAEYRVPYLAHATMEPMNATALLKNGRLDVWLGTQNPTQVRIEAEQMTGLAGKDIHVHTTLMGGGFGRRLEMDYAKQAIALAIAVIGTPIKLTWSREEDMSHDFYRPLAVARFRAAVSNGTPAAIDLQVAAPSVLAAQTERLQQFVAGPDVTIVQSAWDQPYAIPNYRVTGYRIAEQLPIGWWRSVGASQNGFFHESMIDELAHAANRDPLQMRLAMINHEPSRNVLQAVAQMSGWGSELPASHARGVAFVLSFGVPVAEVIEIEATADGIKVLKAFAAVDVGTAVDPGNIEAQVQGAINFGLAAAMMGEITVADGRIEQTNFHNFNVLRLNQSPSIEVRILEHGSTLRGIGEPATPPAAPALANAIFAATGQRIRELPLNKHIRFI